MTKLIKYILPLYFLILCGDCAFSQSFSSSYNNNSHVNPSFSNQSLSFREKLWEFSQWFDDHAIFNNFEASATIGSTGIGLEAATPITKWTKIRVGVAWLPRFNVPIDFSIDTYSDGLPSNSFQHVQELVYNLTGLEINSELVMIGQPYLLNFKLLLDVYPFQKDRRWHFTVGFFYGNNVIANAHNKYREKPTLVGLNIYNRAYEYFSNVTDIYDVPIGGGNYLDPSKVKDLKERFSRYGRMGINVGNFKDGTPYIMEPAPDGSLSAKAYVHKFKPYLGAGYTSNLDKTGKWKIGVEAGVLFWGGIPDVIDQNHVNMSKELINVYGKVGAYLRVFRSLPVYPAIEFKISYSLY